jgi:transcriptional regulator GlxA family with amidase domain
MKSHLHVITDWKSLARAARYRSKPFARLTKLSSRQVERFFAEYIGTSPQDWLDELQMEKAEELLKNGMPVKVVAEEVGFKNPTHFCRKYRQFRGQSPMSFLLAQNNVQSIEGPKLRV